MGWEDAATTRGSRNEENTQKSDVLSQLHPRHFATATDTQRHKM
jgi:hypothetical protein